LPLPVLGKFAIRKPERKAANCVAGGSHEVAESGTTVTHKTYIGGAAVVIGITPAPASTGTVPFPARISGLDRRHRRR
jgi:hypothetical protein